MDELARVLLQMHAPDAHLARADLEQTVDAHRQVVLADLIALGQVGIHVVLAVELGVSRDRAVEGEGRLQTGLDRGAVRHGKDAGQAEADLAYVRVRWRIQRSHRAAAEHLRLRLRLDMYLNADHHFPVVRQPTPPRCESRLPLRRRAPLEGRRSRPTADPAPAGRPAIRRTFRT